MRNPRNRILALAASGLLMLSFVTTGVAAQKDKLTVAFDTKFASLDEYKSTQRANIQLGYMIWDSLTTHDPETGELQPLLARSWKTINPTTWEFTLQEGVVFHNGNPLTAECVRYTIEERILAEDQKSPQFGNFKWIKGVEVIDDLHFRLITENPYPLVLERLTTLFVYDPVESKAKGDTYIAEHPMGTGPYKFVRWDRGSQLVMTANENYWREGLPKIKDITLKIIPEISTRVAELLSGGIDVAVKLLPDQWQTLEKAKNVQPLDIPVLRINFWQFDGSGKASETPLMDKRVRQAIWHAIDRQKIIDTLLGGLADILNAPMNPQQFGFDATIKGYDYDPAKAKALLAEAGYPDGFEMDLWQYEGFQNYANQAAMGYLAKIGIKVNLKDYRGNIGQLVKLRNSGKITGVGNYGWGSFNIFDADAVLPAWFLSKEGKCYNIDPELEGWLTEARYSVDPEYRKTLYAKAQKKIIDEAYWMPFFIVHTIYGTQKGLNLIVGSDEVPRFSEAFWE